MLTFRDPVCSKVLMHRLAPGTFGPGHRLRELGNPSVLMHLLVLGAFAPHKAQVTMRFSQES